MNSASLLSNTPSCPLRPSQTDGVRHILSRRGTMLLWDMGCGKTRTVLEARHRGGLLTAVGPMVVVAPMRVAITQRVWEEDAERWGLPFSFVRVHGSASKRSDLVRIPADVYVTTFDLIHTNEVQALLKRCAAQDGWLVIDESSMVKSFGRRFKALRNYASLFSKVILLTGTPTPNGMTDLFYQIQLIDNGAAWGKNKQTWINKRFYPIDRHRVAPHNEESLYQDIAHMVHRADNVDLPPVVPQRIDVQLRAEIRPVYAEMLRDYVAQVRDKTITAANAGVRGNKLRQLCSGFVFDEHGEVSWIPEQRNARLNALEELLSELASPAIVLYDFTPDRDAIRERFPHARTLDDPGAIQDWNAGNVDILLMHPASGGHGLNLQHGGNHTVWYSLPWSLELWKQTNARLARPGQKADKVFAHILTAKGTVEQRVYQLLCEKELNEQALLDWFAFKNLL